MEHIIRKSTTSLGELIIKPVSKQLAKEMIIKNHYSHKWNNAGFGVYNFGIFKEESPNVCLGVAVYGYVKNQNARLFEHRNPKGWMCELNRLWIDDVLGMNAETLLIGATIKLLRKIDKDLVAIQSFADGRLGCGTIYKAANFKYFGFHYTKFMINQRTGEVTHEQMLTNTTNTTGYVRANIAYLCGDFKTFQVKTHRYIYPLSKGFKFVRDEIPYPEYTKGMNETVWKRDVDKIKENIILLLDKIQYR